VKRGEIWWAELAPPAGRRPVLLLSRNESYAVRELVMVAPLTTRIRGIPSEVPLGNEDGVPRPCVIDLDTIATIARASLRERLATLSAGKSKEVEEALHFSLGLEW
jgi:mRNA interferase MazF